MTMATTTRSEAHSASSHGPVRKPRSADPTRRPGTTDADDHIAAMDDIVDTWGLDSFPASDPPANW
jgi:hypothetical protein